MNQGTTVCFMGIFSKTNVFKEIAEGLIRNGVNVCWILTKVEQYNWLKETYSKEKLLLINREHISKPNTVVGDYKINELIFGDRTFKHEMENGVKFYTNIQRPIYDFILKNKIRFVFGEVTSGHEALIVRMCRQHPELNCDYLQCNDIRIPAMRCAFLAGEGEFMMVKFNNSPAQAEVIKLEKPKYLALNNQILKKSKSIWGRLNRVKRFITGENIERFDPIVSVDKRIRFKLASTEELNRTQYSFIKKKKFADVENEKFIFFGFHKQPENTIDVQGRYSEDQSMIVTNLWRMLPPGWKLVVKEHSSAVGDRSYGFYKKLLKLPGVVIVEETIDSKILIQNSQLVVTVCGTMSYEAALLKKPAITLCKTFFNGINFCKLTPFAELVKYSSLTLLIDEIMAREDNRLEFSNTLMKNSFDAYITDFNTDPTVLAEENIAKLTKAFLTVVECYGNKALEVYEPTGK